MRRSRLVAAVVVTIALLGAAGVAELGLRILWPVSFRAPRDPGTTDLWKNLIHRPSETPGLDYEIAPNPGGLAAPTREGINALGFRGPMPAPREEVDQRIVVLGDSFTYGLGIPVERTYPAVLETLLRELGDGIRREVLNLGVTAYSTLDEAIVLETKGMALEPDLVLVGYVLNDPERIGYQPLRNHYAPVQWWQRSHLLRLVAKARLDWFIRTQGDGDYTRSMYADGRGWTNVEEGFDRMRTVSVDSGVPVVVIIFPMIPDREWTGYAYHDLHDRVAAAARARGFPVLDMYDALSRRPPEGLRISEEDWHPNARGHRLSAVAIRDFLVERDLLN